MEPIKEPAQCIEAQFALGSAQRSHGEGNRGVGDGAIEVGAGEIPNGEATLRTGDAPGEVIDGDVNPAEQPRNSGLVGGVVIRPPLQLEALAWALLKTQEGIGWGGKGSQATWKKLRYTLASSRSGVIFTDEIETIPPSIILKPRR